MRRLIILIAIALVAAACGSDGTSDTFTAPETTLGEPAGTTSPTTADAGTTSTIPTGGDTTTTPPATPAELPDSDYPDVVVADLAGGELNLKELALETEPVLLWFWAPH
ncbi:MAG: hypothetical protein HKO63_06500 [Acidimicrobiia bacterium]|nr:hypothetical protein [Acidimicrobiia bacterium]MBT8246891.1 hypothetical protein [Acidimicrobiia bacterium]NNF69882.1 hypothetical protein [Acidimicrobiia bacterium]NNL13908.1 hypothetical protein [Acidimicrobiia bacterium]NNL97837.1 hypothetical protein [Acidimicrobiia bacterium]